MKWFQIVILTVVSILLNGGIRHVHSHGRMMDPPGRNAMWRFGYPTPVNYDDNQLWCGGWMAFTENGGKCGVCGDNYADPTPREHEAGGVNGQGLVTRRYSRGQLIETEVELTANHRGHFEFRLCPASDSTIEVTEECLEENRLQVADEEGNLTESFTLTNDVDKMFTVRLQLPKEMTCSHCVLQWTYIAANSWGICPNGTEAIGCGKQETFKNCADIAILANDGARPPSATQVPPKNMVLVRDDKSGELIPLVVRSQVCSGTGTFSSQPGINQWCQENCLRYPPNCPEDKCKCVESCEPQGAFRNETGAEHYCNVNCIVFPPKNCDKEKCNCF